MDTRRAEQYRDAMMTLLGVHAARLDGRPEDGPLLLEGVPKTRLFTAAHMLFRAAVSQLADEMDVDELDVVRYLARRVTLAKIEFEGDE